MCINMKIFTNKKHHILCSKDFFPSYLQCPEVFYFWPLTTKLCQSGFHTFHIWKDEYFIFCKKFNFHSSWGWRQAGAGLLMNVRRSLNCWVCMYAFAQFGSWKLKKTSLELRTISMEHGFTPNTTDFSIAKPILLLRFWPWWSSVYF